jgi:hypothetical protein
MAVDARFYGGRSAPKSWGNKGGGLGLYTHEDTDMQRLRASPTM